MQQDDRLRAEVIMHLMCSMPVPILRLEARYGIDFASYFSAELQELNSYADAGLLTVDAQSIQVLPKGRLFVRAYSMVFDKLLEPGKRCPLFPPDLTQWPSLQTATILLPCFWSRRGRQVLAST